jgi:hypothetical protein
MRARTCRLLVSLLGLTALLTPLLGPAAPALATITFVHSLGTGSAFMTTTLTITTTNPVAAGDSIIVAVATDNATASISCSDPVNHSYSIDVSSTNNATAICSKHNVQALAMNSQITVTISSTTNEIAASAAEFAGLAATSTLDKMAPASGSGFSPSVTLGSATSQANELLLGAINRFAVDLKTGFTAGSNGTVNDNCANTGNTSYSPLQGAAAGFAVIYPEYCIVAATFAY